MYISRALHRRQNRHATRNQGQTRQQAVAGRPIKNKTFSYFCAISAGDAVARPLGGGRGPVPTGDEYGHGQSGRACDEAGALRSGTHAACRPRRLEAAEAVSRARAGDGTAGRLAVCRSGGRGRPARADTGASAADGRFGRSHARWLRQACPGARGSRRGAAGWV
eukprot:scaffold1238_cov116-Isochrysis_galbana.AAC.2